MGEQSVDRAESLQGRTASIQHLIDDVAALELMLDHPAFADDVVRIGAEQERCLGNEQYMPLGSHMAQPYIANPFWKATAMAHPKKGIKNGHQMGRT